jgi:hypothetical protein
MTPSTAVALLVRVAWRGDDEGSASFKNPSELVKTVERIIRTSEKPCHATGSGSAID